MPIDFEHVHEDLNPKSLLTSDELSSDSFVQKVAREVYVVGGGTLAGAAKECYDDVTQHTGEFALRTAGGVVIGALLSASHFGPKPIRCAGRAISVGLGLAMLSDLLDRRRWSELGTAISDTWSSSNGLDKNFAAVQKTLGRLTYETALMAGGAKLGALGTTAGFKAAGFKLPLDASSARPGTQPESGDQLTTANRVHYAQGKPGTLDGQIRLAAEKRASEALAARREQEAADMLLRDKQTQAKPRETSEETWPVYQETRLLGEMNWRLNQRLDLLKHGEYALAEDFRDMRSLLHENNKQWFREHEKWRSTVDPGYKSRPESGGRKQRRRAANLRKHRQTSRRSKNRRASRNGQQKNSRQVRKLYYKNAQRKPHSRIKRRRSVCYRIRWHTNREKLGRIMDDHQTQWRGNN